MKRHRPGPGWRHVNGAVYAHTSGLVIHTYGLAMIPGTIVVWGTRWPESQRLDKYIKINGGNRCRGVMAWAIKLDRPETPIIPF